MYSKHFDIKKPFAFALLVGYLAALLPQFHVHGDYEHDHKVEHSTLIHETDACHNFIYHGLSEGENHDHEHLYNLEHKCFTCQFYKNQPKLVVQESHNSAVAFLFKHHLFSISDNYFNVQRRSISLRGPPSLA